MFIVRLIQPLRIRDGATTPGPAPGTFTQTGNGPLPFGTARNP